MTTKRNTTYSVMVTLVDLFKFLRDYEDDEGYYKTHNWLILYLADLLAYGEWKRKVDSIIWGFEWVPIPDWVGAIKHKDHTKEWAKIDEAWENEIRKGLPKGINEDNYEFIHIIDDKAVHDYLVDIFTENSNALVHGDK